MEWTVLGILFIFVLSATIVGSEFFYKLVIFYHFKQWGMGVRKELGILAL